VTSLAFIVSHGLPDGLWLDQEANKSLFQREKFSSFTLKFISVIKVFGLPLSSICKNG
jgi:hypothetical protein